MEKNSLVEQERDEKITGVIEIVQEKAQDRNPKKTQLSQEG